MAEYDGLTQYRKSAARRLRDAEELLQPPSLALEEQGAETRHLRGAVYLAGYAVECILKAYIISQSGSAMSLADVVEERKQAGEQMPNILGADGHNLSLLLSLTDLEERLTTDEHKKDWGTCVKWKSTWRYDPNPPTARFASEIVIAVRNVYRWVERQI